MFKQNNLVSKFVAGFVIAAILVLNVPVVASAFLDKCSSAVCYSLDAKSAGTWYTDNAPSTPGGLYPLRVAFWNTTGQTITNINVKGTIPAGMQLEAGTMQFYGINPTFNEADYFTSGGINLTGISLAHNESFQIIYQVNILDAPAGIFNLTSTTTISSSRGTFTDNVIHNVTSTGPAAGKALINEINHAPRADYSNGGDYRLSGRGNVDLDDEWVELYIKANGLDLTSASWVLYHENNGGTSTTGQLLSLFSSYQYISATGGTVTNTKIGDYLLLNNPALPLMNNLTLKVSWLGNVMDDVSFSSDNSGLVDETFGRDASSTDTNALADFSRNVGTPGRANVKPAPGVYEAEDRILSQTGNAHGVEIFDNAAGNNMAVELTPGTDLSGETFRINTTANQAAGYYQAVLRAKVTGATSAQLNSLTEVPFGSFTVKYPNGLNRNTGFYVMSVSDFDANNEYRDFIVQFRKPATTGLNNEYVFSLSPSTPANVRVVIDKLTVSAFTPNPNRTYEAENFYTKAGSLVNEPPGRVAVFSPRSSISSAWQSVSHYQYVADQLDGTDYKATWTIKILNIDPALGANAEVARLEIRNHFDNTIYTRRILKGEVASSDYELYSIDFVANTTGSYQYRVVTNVDGLGGKADIYVDKVSLQSMSAPGTRVYEIEDFFTQNGGAVELDATASRGQAVVARTAATAEGTFVSGPMSLAEANGQYYKACFYLRAPIAPATNVQAARIRVISTIGATNKILADTVITQDMLRNTSYLPYCLNFKAETSGTTSYQVSTYDVTTIMADKVVVTPLGSNPVTKVYQAESMSKTGGVINYSDSSASNDKGLPTGISVVGNVGSADGKWLSTYGAYETQVAGNYTVSYRLRKSGTIGNSGNNIAVLRVVDSTGATLKEETIQENDLTGGFTDVTLSNVVLPANRVMHFRVYYYGNTSGITSDLSFDKVTLTRN